MEEVGFEAMLALVQDCERLQDDDNVEADKRGSLQLDDGNNKNLSLMTLMSGIVPGKQKLFCCAFTMTSARQINITMYYTFPCSCMGFYSAQCISFILDRYEVVRHQRHRRQLP